MIICKCLGELKEGEKINLERAMSGASRFGGHFVQVGQKSR